MKDITLVCVDAGGGHACGLSLGLRKYCNLTTVWKNNNVHGLDYLEPAAMMGFKNIPKGGDELIIMSNITQIHIEKYFKRGYRSFLKNWDKVKIIITDGTIILNPELHNAKMEGMEVFATLCKIDFRGDLPTKTYYQPFDLSHIEIKKNKELTVAHSPLGSVKMVEKGTNEIKREMRKRNVKFDIISMVPWTQALKRKACSHIFIDQLYNPLDKYGVNLMHSSIGKSGIEAMHLESLVFTRGLHKPRELPSPPVVWIADQPWAELMDYYISHPVERQERVTMQKEWALKYATHDFAARNVLGI
ncbi:hypothetical protein KAR91_26280 [Candidatus Pacearchaeota archaeon]|nr:hypothetical protein [Candidatus Pacearchaeota archaeon]